MGHIKEPDGVDLVIKSRPLTNEEELAISNYIRAYKAKHSSKKATSKRATSTERKKVADPLMKK
jgi:hypothetical protein